MTSNVPRQKLCEIVSRYGESVCDDPRRCEGLLRDFCGGQRREIHVLVTALRERIAADLLASSDTVPREVLVARLSKKLEDNLGLDRDVARWAVESWGLALGKLTSADLKKANGKPKEFGAPEDNTETESQKPSPVRAKKPAAPAPSPAPAPQPAPEPDPNLLWDTGPEPEPAPFPEPVPPRRNYKLVAGIALSLVLVVGAGISLQQWRAAEEAKRQAQLRAEQLRREADYRRQQALLLQQQQRARWEQQQRERALWEQQQRQRQRQQQQQPWQPRQPTWQEQQRQAQLEQQRRQWEQQRQAQLVEQQRRQQEAEQRRLIQEGAKIIERLFR
jgi:hypothetical protein